MFWPDGGSQVALKEDKNFITKIQPCQPDCQLIQELRGQSQDFYRKLFDELPFPMWQSDVQNRYVFFNRAWLEFTGRRMEDEVGDGWWAGVYPDDVDRCRKLQKRVISKHAPFERELRLRRHDGAYRWIAGAGRPFFELDGQFAGYIGTGYDITEHKQAEDQISKLTQFSEIVIDNANVWLSVMDENLNAVIWNKAAEKISGYTREQVIGNSQCWEWIYPNKSYREEIMQMTRSIYERNETLEDFETVIQTRKGEERVISWNSRSLLDKKGVLIGAVNLGRDVTKSKQAHSQLLQAQKMEAISQLAGGIAHDLNNEMSVIQGYVDINIPRVDESSPVYRALQRIRSAAERSAHLTHQLLLSSRRQPQNREPMNLNHNIRDMQEMLEWFCGGTIESKLALAHDLWMINGDSANLEQVITNLALNARDAMPKGGQLTIRTENVVGSDTCPFGQQDDLMIGRFVRLTISDTGTGMDAHVKAHLFEPFFTTKEIGKGTGLGLSMVYGIIEAHEGWVNVTSEIGQGSTFNCYLPALVPEARKKN
jgi:two-component system cell cycle sensor histidine kinase/response regulator CckA